MSSTKWWWWFKEDQKPIWWFKNNRKLWNPNLGSMVLLAQGQTQSSAPRVHQQALTIGPFGYTCEADAVSPETAMGGLHDRDAYNQGNYQVDPALK
jgi:hypothetical protein